MTDAKPLISHTEIIARAGGSTKVARILDDDANRVSAWKRLNSIPSPYWKGLVDAGLASYKELADHAAAAKAQAA